MNNVPCPKPVPIEQRQNPRRSSQCSRTNGEVRAPPTLVRQSERKDCFVAILVAFAAQLVEAIWPLAAVTPRSDTCFFGRGVLPLRTFITETLRRSRTSYSTLQVALFYLVLIKDIVPKHSFCTEQPRAGDEFRSMQCGRRMFLTALILASKYLQDRNYSTRAWSKISGLRAQEIHVNEMNYCKVIGWNLHLPQEKFQRWSRIVLTLSRPMMGPGSDTVAQRIGWPTVLSKLDIDLSEDFENLAGLPRTCSLATLPLSANFSFGDNPAEKQGLEQFQSIYNNDVPVADSTAQPSRPLATPSPRTTSQPPLPRIHNLPTPQSTPQTHSFANFTGTPGSSMSTAMAQARNSCFMRATLDACPPPVCIPRLEEKGRSCLSRSASSISSPSESVISDVPSVYSRASRSSSISSMASSVSSSSVLSKLDRRCVQRSGGFRDNRNDIILEKSTQILTSSPESMEDSRSSTSGPQSAPEKKYWSSNANKTKNDYLQELEVAATLCNLCPLDTPSPSSNNQLIRDRRHEISTPSRHLMTSAPSAEPAVAAAYRFGSIPCSSQESTPNAACLNNLSNFAACDFASSVVTPTNFTVTGYRKENVKPQSCHKRSHSKVADTLQDQVRAQLRNSVWASQLPDRTMKVGSSPRNLPAQSPTLTYGIQKMPMAVKGSDGQKRHCVYEVSAADRATQMLRNDLIKPIR